MNKNNMRTHFRDGILYGTLTTRDPDDPDDDGTPVWWDEVPAEGLDDRLALKRLTGLLARQYDEWQNGWKYE